MAFGGATECEHGRVPSSDPFVGEADVDETLSARRLERRECLELIERVLSSAHPFVRPCQFLTCGRERGVQLEGTTQRAQRLRAVRFA